MSEAYSYGGNGSLERLEYNKLNEQDLGMYLEMVGDELESFFLSAQPSPEIDYIFHQTDEKICRNIDFSYITTHSEPETTLLFDTDNGYLLEYEPPIVPVGNNVRISYNQYETGSLREEYIVNIDRNDAGTKGYFSNRYHFGRYVGNNWQATVNHTDIDAVPLEDNGKYYSRDMTPYDFDEFFKDTAEINTQLRMRLVQ